MDGRQNERDRQQQHADTVEEHPHTQVKEQETDQHQGWRRIQIHDGFCKRARHAREPEKVHEYQHAGDDGEDQRGGPRGFQHDVLKRGPVQPSPGQQQGAGRAAAGRFRWCGDTGIDAAHDDEDQHHHAPDTLDRREPVLPGDALNRGTQIRIDLEPNVQHRAVAHGFQQPRRDAGEQQGTDRFLGNEAVEHLHHGWGNHRRHGAAGGNATGRNLVIVVKFFQLRQGDFAHHSG